MPNNNQPNNDHELLFGRLLLGFRCNLLLLRARVTSWDEL